MTSLMRQNLLRAIVAALVASCGLRFSAWSLISSYCLTQFVEGVDSFTVVLLTDAVHHKRRNLLLNNLPELTLLPQIHSNVKATTFSTQLSIFAFSSKRTRTPTALSSPKLSQRIRQITKLRAGASASTAGTATKPRERSSLLGRRIKGDSANNESRSIHFRNNIGRSLPPPPPPRASAAPITNSPSAAKQFISLFLVSSISCLSTWAWTVYGGMSPVRSSSLHGLLACLIGLPPPLTAATLSGAFSGMSTYLNILNNHSHGFLSRWKDIGLLSTLTGLVYAVEATNPSLQWVLAGKGGRLGSLSVVASLLFWVLHRDAKSFVQLHSWIVNDVGVSTVVGIAVAVGIFVGAQENLARLQALVSSLQKRTSRAKQLSSLILGTSKRLRLDNNYMDELQNNEPVVFMSSAPPEVVQLQRELFQAQRWLTSIAKIVMLAVLARHSLLEKKHPISALIESTLVTFVCSLFLYQRCTKTWGGTVLSYSLVGLLASLLDEANRHIATPMCVGGLLGMTRLPGFQVHSHLEASLWLTLLLYNNNAALAGVGGRLGVFTVLSVVLAHTPWWWPPSQPFLSSLQPEPSNQKQTSSSALAPHSMTLQP
ncbi:hypothetical protein ACA910_022032 [Epithemia clementina (nom. ined.)]